MKFANILLAGASTAWACATEGGEPLYAVENFITSDAVEFELLMDSVMGGISQATLESDNGILKFDGQLRSVLFSEISVHNELFQFGK